MNTNYKEISNPFKSSNYIFIDFDDNAIQKSKVVEIIGINIEQDYKVHFYLLAFITLILIILLVVFLYRNFNI
jgi:hypothetical protein